VRAREPLPPTTGGRTAQRGTAVSPCTHGHQLHYTLSGRRRSSMEARPAQGKQ
jgi:hypothetical protein